MEQKKTERERERESYEAQGSQKIVQPRRFYHASPADPPRQIANQGPLLSYCVLTCDSKKI